MPRLLRFSIMNGADTPFTARLAVAARVVAAGSFSTLITSAPMSASIMPQVGPGHDLRELEDLDAGQRTAALLP